MVSAMPIETKEKIVNFIQEGAPQWLWERRCCSHSAVCKIVAKMFKTGLLEKENIPVDSGSMSTVSWLTSTVVGRSYTAGDDDYGLQSSS